MGNNGMRDVNAAFLLSRRELILAGLGIIFVPPAIAGATRDPFLANAPAALKDRLAELGRLSRRTQVGHVNIPRLYRDLDALPGSRDAVDLRSFGARQDGETDDTDAVRNALGSSAQVIRISGGGVVRITRSIDVDRSVAFVGAGDGTSIRYTGAGAVFNVGLRQGGDTDFLHDLRFDRLVVSGPGNGNRTPPLIQARNVRGISLTRSKISNMGGLVVRHALERKINFRGEGAPRSPDVDPAVLGGFSAASTDDLNEDVVLIDNEIACDAYFAQALRVNFGKRLVAAYNRCRHANISWWGGGGRVIEGGAMQFLRRVREFAIVGNEVHGSLGGIYGNNGDNVLIEDNMSDDVLDCGIDFEGCFNSIARRNICRDAGNFAYSTFFAAKNVSFEHNIAIQTGKGASAPQRLGSRPVGKPTGTIVFALRSAGFAGEGKIEVACTNNTFAFTGPAGLGYVLPSYSSSLNFSENEFLNVKCNLKYSQSGVVVINRNAFVYTQPSLEPEVLVGIGDTRPRSESRIVDNTLLIAADMPKGSAALGAVQRSPGRTVISGNDVKLSGGSVEYGLLIRTEKPEDGKEPEFVVRDNRLPSIVDRSEGGAANVLAEGNVDAGGSGVGVVR
ncbi:right-handed parallel beta-helix repeat-containing protein [Xanthobacter tagetidis]|uniref:Right-handed parallel beta-helix repeat-containing protein n=2 Tax=Xanthobacter tagetidis TaxID=60216 RepID=A0A3L7AL30_9HYPH|nr:right-handed parallel beta-helix repeat-containing protein [Xanthobacter tagetidis]